MTVRNGQDSLAESLRSICHPILLLLRIAPNQMQPFFL
jgi:hypothetical protein